jgi:GTP-sensing pleiotropic transcriptional regulator CodY
MDKDALVEELDTVTGVMEAVVMIAEQAETEEEARAKAVVTIGALGKVVLEKVKEVVVKLEEGR